MSARSHPARLLPFLPIVWTVFVGAGAAFAGGGPAEATGDIRFVVDASSFLRSGAVSEEIYLLLPTEDLRFESPKEGASPEAEIRVSFQFHRWPTGEPILDKTLDALLPSVPEGESGADMQLLQHAFDIPEGPYRLVVTVEDRKTLGFGFFHLFGRRGNRSEAVCFFQARPFDAWGLGVSDIEFARSIEPNEEGPFVKGASEVIPQPGRLYGALMPELSFYYEIYDNNDRRDPAGETYLVTHEIVDGAGGVVDIQEQVLSARGEGRLFRRSAVMEITDLPAGEYRLRVAVESPSRSEAVVAEGPFRVAWKLADFATRPRGRGRAESWDYGDRVDDDLVEEMRVLLSQGELEALKGMTHDQRRAWIDEYWAVRDPTPGTDVNELREEHYRRIRVANTRFASIRLKGMETDRGRIFVRYGEPDEIRSAFADQSFLDGVDDIGGAGAFGQTGRDRGGINVSEKQYEVWTYTERGRILGDRGKVSSGLGMRFVFVDVEGYGNFRLVESSELSDY